MRKYLIALILLSLVTSCTFEQIISEDTAFKEKNAEICKLKYPIIVIDEKYNLLQDFDKLKYSLEDYLCVVNMINEKTTIKYKIKDFTSRSVMQGEEWIFSLQTCEGDFCNKIPVQAGRKASAGFSKISICTDNETSYSYFWEIKNTGQSNETLVLEECDLIEI